MNRIVSVSPDGYNVTIGIDTQTTTQQLAAQFLLDPSYSLAVDSINGLDYGQPLPAGESVSVPVSYLKPEYARALVSGGSTVPGYAQGIGGFSYKQIGVGVGAVVALFWLLDRSNKRELDH